MKIFFNNFRNFRAQILLAFTLLLVLIIVWFLFYLQIDKRADKLDNFTYKTYGVSKDFSANIKNFQSFLLFGYKQKDFYIHQKQNDIDCYIVNLRSQKERVNQIFRESKELKIDLNQHMIKLSNDIDSLYNNVLKFKGIALIRGFKDYGVEGKMRDKAHMLEVEKSIDRVQLLQLRRHEKDYLLRSEELYFKEFEQLINRILKSNSVSQKTKKLLLDYNNNFEQLVYLTSELGVIQNQGLYGKINNLNTSVEDSFVQITDISKKRVNKLNQTLFYFQTGQTLLIAILGLLLCIYISRYFTKDIKKLTLDISNYIQSNFKDTSHANTQKSSIGEVDFLFKSYGILKEKLTENIVFLEKATEQANKTSAFKSQFLANMSHEIRSPLNGVVGMLNILKTKNLSNEQMGYVETAEHSADHLLGIVNMILDHSKMEAGKMKIDNYPIHLRRELTKLIRLFEYRIKDKNIEIHFTYDSKINSTILGDNLRLQQVLINLIDNAIKFTSKGEVKVEVTLVSQIGNIQYLKFKVMDSGIGIDINKTEQLLLAFEQADLSTTRKYGGTGLGLTIANQLIQLLGGSKLNIEAVMTGGSTFSFELPFLINTEEIVSEEEIKPTVHKISVSKALVVEDNIINQKVLIKLLEKINIPSDIACNGKEAVLLYEQNDYDIIFMDLHMPEMDGFEATAQIHGSPKYKSLQIPIIAVTASAFDEDKTKAISNGMDDFITKPVILKDLEETIAKQLNLKNFLN